MPGTHVSSGFIVVQPNSLDDSGASSVPLIRVPGHFASVALLKPSQGGAHCPHSICPLCPSLSQLSVAHGSPGASSVRVEEIGCQVFSLGSVGITGDHKAGMGLPGFQNLSHSSGQKDRGP